ncbi:MAG: MBL fold metallo-hydrolase [Chrysiogenales bacterium]|nr:MAG: MBL fold metallo-hydrolase [Chrysiogenales bacterium]
MDNQILIRVYNVGLGDCIYMRVPDGHELRHVLIDCGTFSRGERLMKALKDLEKNYLPKDGNGKFRLDLLVVTHNHKDHLSGFGLSTVSNWFQNIHIGQIWLSAGMNRDHPQAGKTFRLLEFADRTVSSLSAISLGSAFDALANDLLSSKGKSDSESNVKALTMLSKTLPGRSPAKKPVYVDDSMSNVKAPKIFSESETRIHVLAPAYDIDGTYLGKLGEAFAAFEQFQCQVGAQKGKNIKTTVDLAVNFQDPTNRPTNIDAGDFQRLRQRLIYQALAFVIKGHGELANNTSAVLLLEWRKRRLLFVGDAQCKTGRKNIFVTGAINGSWNAMWEKHKNLLGRPLDFLKVGHHGSHNATPWSADNAKDPVNKILDSLIPPSGSDCRVVVSTERAQSADFKRNLPRKELMMELGRRLRKPETQYDEAASYPDLVAEFGSYFVPAGKPQPMRTDLHEGDCVTVKIS